MSLELDTGNTLEWECATDKYIYNYWKDRAAFVHLLTSTNYYQLTHRSKVCLKMFS